jgi:hypothetical protein
VGRFECCRRDRANIVPTLQDKGATNKVSSWRENNRGIVLVF